MKLLKMYWTLLDMEVFINDMNDNECMRNEDFTLPITKIAQECIEMKDKEYVTCTPDGFLWNDVK